MAKQEHHIEITTHSALPVDLLSDKTGLSMNTIKQAMQKGAVWLTRDKYTQRLRRAKRQLKAGDTLHIYYNEDILNENPHPAELIADETEYSVWYKPYGMRSQGSKWGDHTTIVRWAETHIIPQRPAFTVHRLDRAATGLILIAHTKQTATHLSKLFETRAIKKTYRALVEGHFPDSPQTYTTPLDGRTAHSIVRCLRYDHTNDTSLVEVEIHTGRKHQIRRHLSEAQYPIIGDRLYGSSTSSRNLQLMAYSLAFTCPITQQDKFYELSNHTLPT